LATARRLRHALDRFWRDPFPSALIPAVSGAGLPPAGRFPTGLVGVQPANRPAGCNPAPLSSDPQIVDPLEWRAALPANDCAAIPARQRLGRWLTAAWTVEFVILHISIVRHGKMESKASVP